MPTNEDRRKVARELRELAADKLDLLPSECVMIEISKTIGDQDGWNSLTVLADLIEPTKTGIGSFSGVCPKCGGSTYVVCDDYDWWVITCDACGAVHGFNPDNYIPYGEIERKWKQELQELAKIPS